MKFTKILFFIFYLQSLFLAKDIYADNYSNVLGQIALKQDAQQMKDAVGSMLTPFFQVLSRNHFPALASENIGVGIASSFVQLPFEQHKNLFIEKNDAYGLQNKTFPFFSAYLGGRIPFYGVRLWSKAFWLPQYMSSLPKDISAFSIGLGKEYDIWDSTPLLSSQLIVSFSYHEFKGLPSIKEMNQFGFDLILAARTKFILGVKPFISVGFFHQKWESLFSVQEMGDFNFSKSISKSLKNKKIDHLKSSNAYLSIPVTVGLRVDIGLLDVFLEYSIIGEKNVSIATGLSF